MTLAAALVLMALIWAVAVRPALHTLRTAPVELQALESDLGHMQALQARIQALQALPPLDASAALEHFHASTQKLLGNSAQGSQAGSLLRVQITNVGATALAQWLTTLGEDARLRPASADLRRTPPTTDVPGSAAKEAQWSGTLTFNLPA